MTDVFVYYQLRSELASLMLPHVHAMQAELKTRFGIAVALKRRPEEKDGLQTWMEVYASVPDGFLQVLEQVAIDAHLPLAGERHIEVFTDLPACA